MHTEPFAKFARNRLGTAIALVLVLFGWIRPVPAASPTVDVRGAITHANNLNNAEISNQQQHDTILELDATLGFRKPLNEMAGLVAKAGVESDLHAKTTDINALTLIASLALVVQPDRSFSAPWFALSGDFRWRRHNNSDIRDGTLASVELSTGKRFTDRVSMRVGYEFMDRNADEGRTFDLTQQTLSAVLDYQLSNRAKAYFKYQYLRGGLVTTALPMMKFRGVTRAFAMDPAFGPGFVAWRLDGRAQLFRFGANYRLAEKTALDGSIAYSHAHAQNDNQWNNWLIGASVVHRFD